MTVRLTDILTKVRSYDPAADTDLINKAYLYAARMHEGQMRKSGEPYFVHPVSVANLIADLHLDTQSICAALLHDVVEDCEGVENEDIASLFSEEISFLVDGVTKLGKVNFTSKEDRQAESFRKMLVAMARDIRVLLVKLADRLDNMRTLEHMKPESQERIARETIEIYAPLAGRLGIHWIKAELEDLSFRYLYPDVSVELEQKIKKATKDTSRYIEDVEKRVKRMLITRGFAMEVTGRRKHAYSIYRKMRRTGCAFEQIHDLVAFRVLMENVSDCYAALGVIHSEWTPIPGRFKDYIALPKPNMYQSLHTTVIGPGNRRIEVQIRTQAMHRTAELGIAAHWQYKAKGSGPSGKDAERFAWLRQLMEFQKDVADPAEFYESIKVDLFPDDVYVFTPQGDVKTFPRGASPLDFAYSIHSEVGNHCTGARINGVMVPLKHELHNGDVVEILTRKDQHPSKDWLGFVASGRARSKIRAYLRSEERKRSINLGRDLVERALRKHDISINRFTKSGELKKALEKLRLGSENELYAQVGYGKLSAAQAVETVAPEKSEARESLRPSFFERTVNRVTGADKTDGIRIDGIDDILVRYAKCCTPVAGDPVVGWITRGRGVTVHRRECPRAMELDPDRRVDVSWAKSSTVDLPVALRITTSDTPGILTQVSAVFTDNGVNISEATCRSTDGHAVNTFQFSVRDLSRLRSVMRGISRVTGVQEVERL